MFLLGNITGAKHVLHIPLSAVCLPSDKIKDWKEPSWELLCTKNWSNQKPAKKPGVAPFASTCLQIMFLVHSFSLVFPIVIFHGLHFEPRSLLSWLPFELASSFPQVCSHLVCSVIAVLLQTVFTLAFCLLNSIHTSLFLVNAVLKHYPVILSISCSSLFTLSTAAGSIMWYK